MATAPPKDGTNEGQRGKRKGWENTAFLQTLPPSCPNQSKDQKMTKFAALATTKPGLRFLDFSLRDFPLSPLADSRQDGDSPIFRAYLYPNLILPFTHKSSEFSTILQNGPSVLFLPPAGSRCLAVTSPHDCHRRTRDTSIQTSLHFGGFGCARRKNID